MGAKSKPQEVLPAADVGDAAAPATAVVAVAPPPARGESRRIEDGSATDAADAIVEFLAEKRLL